MEGRLGLPRLRPAPEGGGAIVETPCRQTVARTSDDQSGEERPAGGCVLAHGSLQRASHLAYAVRWRDVERVGDLGVTNRGRVGWQRLEKRTDACDEGRVALGVDGDEQRARALTGVGEHLVERADRRRTDVRAVRVAEEHEHRVAPEGREGERLPGLVRELERRSVGHHEPIVRGRVGHRQQPHRKPDEDRQDNPAGHDDAPVDGSGSGTLGHGGTGVSWPAPPRRR